MRHFAAPLAFLALAACQPEPVIPGKLDTTGEVLSTVNNVNVTQGTLDAILAAMPAATRDQITASGQLAQFKERLVMEEILYQEAIKQKVHERPEVKTQLVLAEREALVSALVQDVVEKRLTDERLKAWYDEHKVQFARTQANARHVLVKDEKDAKAIYEQLKAGGADFAAIAKEKSTDKGSGAEGGDLKWFDIAAPDAVAAGKARAQMVPEFNAAVFNAAGPGLLAPIESKFGWHVIEVLEKRDGIPFEDVKEKLKAKVRNEEQQAYIEELKKAATVVAPGAAPAAGATVAPAQGGAAPAAMPAAPAAAPAAGK